MNYAIEILEKELERLEFLLKADASPIQPFPNKIDDINNAIHNLEMLEPKTERFEKVGMIPDEGVDQLNDLFKYFGDTFNPEKL
jgi:hypothetical protein